MGKGSLAGIHYLSTFSFAFNRRKRRNFSSSLEQEKFSHSRLGLCKWDIVFFFISDIILWYDCMEDYFWVSTFHLPFLGGTGTICSPHAFWVCDVHTLNWKSSEDVAKNFRILSVQLVSSHLQSCFTQNKWFFSAPCESKDESMDLLCLQRGNYGMYINRVCGCSFNSCDLYEFVCMTFRFHLISIWTLHLNLISIWIQSGI